MPINKCPLCGKVTGCAITEAKDTYLYIRCESYGFECFIQEELLNEEDGNEKKERSLDLVVEHLLRKPYCYFNEIKYKWGFYYDPKYRPADSEHPFLVNIAERIESFPKTINELADRALLNLSIRFPGYEERIWPRSTERRTVFEHRNLAGRDDLSSREIIRAHYALFTELGLLRKEVEKIGSVTNTYYKISVRGWERIDELQRRD